jgi:hypothetical protein
MTEEKSQIREYVMNERESIIESRLEMALEYNNKMLLLVAYPEKEKVEVVGYTLAQSPVNRNIFVETVGEEAEKQNIENMIRKLPAIRDFDVYFWEKDDSASGRLTVREERLLFNNKWIPYQLCANHFESYDRKYKADGVEDVSEDIEESIKGDVTKFCRKVYSGLDKNDKNKKLWINFTAQPYQDGVFYSVAVIEIKPYQTECPRHTLELDADYSPNIRKSLVNIIDTLIEDLNEEGYETMFTLQNRPEEKENLFLFKNYGLMPITAAELVASTELR